uniref:Uncharacterized protein n=1 Tax=Spongospora subterranea TaxID=70186 RepID=A0A0H5RCA0_9EUKA|eukprot:CRZ06129.1 hypothetical protein [Spongospora subterranea]
MKTVLKSWRLRVHYNLQTYFISEIALIEKLLCICLRVLFCVSQPMPLLHIFLFSTFFYFFSPFSEETLMGSLQSLHKCKVRSLIASLEFEKHPKKKSNK